jgi:hypothetical protein
MTPEHKVFTTRGLVYADALRQDDEVITDGDVSCLKLGRAKLMGYRAAFIESSEASVTGFGRLAEFTSRRKAGALASFIAKHLGMVCRRFCQLMATAKTLIRTIGHAGQRTAAEYRHPNTCSNWLTDSGFIECRPAGTTHAEGRLSFLRIGMSGSGSTGQSLMDSMSITLTTTGQTIEAKILSCYPQASTRGCMLKTTNGLEASPTKSKLPRPAKRLQSGTEAMKAGNGIESTVVRHGLISLSIWHRVMNAALAMKPTFPGVRASAARIASLDRLNVENVPVYDLTVEHDHCYFAQGVLVSNSDAMRQWAQGFMEGSAGSKGFRRHRGSWRA